jgi:sterol desaturase/sphingolipid hydroxylase (fatty acid hydroxylase superfamily)
LRRRFSNIGFWIFNLFLAAYLLPQTAFVRPQIEAVSGLVLPSWPITDTGLSFVAGFLLLDLMRYLVHRCEHAVPLFWRLHALHHSDPDVDVTTSVRHHPIEDVPLSAVFWLAVLVLDIPAIVVLCHGLAVFGTAAVQHGNIRLPERLERWLQSVLVTSDMHRIHHSVVFAEANSNYGAVLSIWDRLLGTELPQRQCLKPSQMLLTPWRLPASRAKRVRAAAWPPRRRRPCVEIGDAREGRRPKRPSASAGQR